MTFLCTKQGILDQFNPSLKNFVTMGKHYERALTGQSVEPELYCPVSAKYPLNH